MAGYSDVPLKRMRVALENLFKTGEERPGYKKLESNVSHAIEISLQEPVSASDVPMCETASDSLNTTAGLLRFILQIWPPLIVAGFGSAFTGILLNKFRSWAVFQSIPQLFILIPPLLDLKGDLEMTLNSRLSTEANKGMLKSFASCKNLLIANLALAQVQAVLVSFLAAFYAILLGGTFKLECNLSQALALLATSTTTATLAAGLVGSIMSFVIVISSQYGFNPDNFANSLTASLGDVVTLVVLTLSGTFLNWIGQSSLLALAIMLLAQLSLLPTYLRMIDKHKAVRDVLRTGWVPIVTAMVISGVAGLTLETEIEQFPKMALLMPVVNGVGGNIGAVLASRTATSYHMRGRDEGIEPGIVLLALCAPTHMIFLFSMDRLTSISLFGDMHFVVAYLLVCMLQTALIIIMSRLLAARLWRAGLDPDNWAIPYVTAVADALGTGLLTIAFMKYVH